MRLFISINVPRELHRYCKQLQSQFPEMKNTNEFHLTIQFLGDDIESADLIVKKLKEIQFTPFEIEMGDAAPFGHPKNPRGTWIECKENSKLNNLASNIRKLMEELGYKSDYPFRAHITLGKYKFAPKKIPQKITGEPHKFRVEHFYLMKSILSPEGPKYKSIAQFPE